MPTPSKSNKLTRRALLASAAAVVAAPAAAAALPMPELEMVPIGAATPVPLPGPEFLCAGDWLEIVIAKSGVSSDLLNGSFFVEVIESDPENCRLVLSDGIPIDAVEIRVVPRAVLTEQDLYD